MHNIVISGSNVVPGTNNTQYKYKFPSSITLDKYTSIALVSLNIYFSWFNINASLYNNNKFSYKWFNSSGVLNQTINVTIPDGYYQVSDLNKYLQSVMYANGHYLLDANSNAIYYLSFDTNSILYAVQLYSNPVPTLASAGSSGYTKPTSAWGYPSAATTPQVIIPSTGKFSTLIGINAGTYPTASQSTKYAVSSQSTPQLSPASSLLICCSLCNQPYSSPSNVLYSFSKGDTSFGSTVIIEPKAQCFLPIKQGTYSEMTIEFRDQDYNPVVLQDSQLVMMLVIRTKEDIELQTVK